MDRYDAALVELDRMLNDPDVAMRPDQIWSLVDEVAQRSAAPGHASP